MIVDRLILVTIAGVVVTTLTFEPAKSHDDPLTAWGRAAVAVADPRSIKATPFPMKIEDRFLKRLASDGTRDQEPCSGSRWVYDYVHHIAAGDDGGPQMLLYIGAPPVKVPSRDLSHVSTLLGIHLGDTPDHVSHALHVPRSYVVRSSNHRQFLFLQKGQRLYPDDHIFYDLTMVVFNDGHAVSIWFVHDEN